MKVVHVISGLNAGGAEHFVLELCRHSLSHKEVDMSVISLSAATTINNNFTQTGIRLTTMSRSLSRMGKAFSALRTALNEKPNIIHAHMFHACVIACFAKIFRPELKVIFTLHNNHVAEWYRRIILFSTRFMRKADIIFPHLAVKWYQKQNAVTIANGVDISRFVHLHSIKPPLFTCCFVGRLSEEKNPLFLVELAKKLAANHQFRIRVAGDGPLKDQLVAAVANENLAEYFSIEGYVENIPALLAECHCLLLPSKWEGMPLVALEAGAAGLPVIATPVGNLATLLNESNGYVRDLSSFHETLENIMNHYGDALIIARNFMHKVHEDYSMQKCYERHLQLYWQK